MSNTKSISKNMFFNGILNIFNVVLPLVVMQVICDAIGSDNYGYMSHGDTLYNFFYIFASFGICTYGLREMSKIRDDKAQVRKTFTTLFIITTIATIISTILYIVFTMIVYKDRPYYYTCLIVSVNLASNLFYVEWVNQALENYRFITIKTIILRTISYVLMILLVRSSENYYFYVYVVVATNLLNNLISFVYIKRQIKFDFTDLNFSHHIKPMIYAVILSNVGILYTQLDKFMLEHQIGSLYEGHYSLAQRIINMINGVMLTLVTVTIPRLSHYVGTGLKDEYLSLLKKVSRTYFAILFPASIGILCLAKDIISLFSVEYQPVIPVLMVFAIYMLTLGVQNIISNQIIYIHQKERQDSVIIFIGGIINFLLNMLLVALGKFNASTVIGTTVIANIVTIILQYRLAKQCIGSDINLFNFDHMKYLLFSLTFIPITLITKLVINNPFAICVIVIILCTSIYAGILFVTKDELFFTVKDRVFKRFQAILG